LHRLGQSAEVEFRLLGRLTVVDDGRDLTPHRPKQRALLALLLLRAGELVSADEAVDTLWGERPPPAARNAVQGHVSMLRKRLGRGRIETRDFGYVLRLEEDELDLHQFERLVTDARGRAPQEQATMLGRALALFRGTPLEEFRYDAFAAAEASRIDELRLLALEQRVEAELALGRHEEVVPELERLVVETPLRERLWGQLMLALYRSGRQADALAACRRARKRLGELGLEPGPALQRLERQILNQDPVLAAPDAGEVRLPTSPTPFVGRERELADARDVLLHQDVRLLTLTGPGGIGKTRLALEVARSAAPHFPGGAFFVPLASLTNPALILPTVAHATGVGEAGGASAHERLAARFVERPALLVVDNVEHLVEGAPALGGLLADAPSLTLLVTSRAALRLYGEHVYRVPPLDSASASMLFLQRARAVGAPLDQAESTRTAIEAICRRLDRLPLAIELAAARTEALSPAALLERLGDRLGLLTGGPVDHPARQQTLRATLEWSCERLTAPEQRMFRQLAVFAGGWSVDATEVVCANGNTVALLSSLLDKSLLHLEASGPEPRQSMLETIREYASELLERSGDADVLRRRHAEHYLALAEEAEPHLRGDPGTWLERLEREHDNLRAALDRLHAAGDALVEQRLAGALWRFWYLRGHLNEGRLRLERALAADEAGTPERAKVLIGATVMAVNTQDHDAGLARAGQALELTSELGDAWGAAYAGFMLANLEGDRQRARVHYEQSLQSFRELGDEHSALLVTRHLAWAYADLGDLDRARALHEASVTRARETNNPRMEASALGALAEYALDEGRTDDALALLERSLRLHRDVGDVLDSAVDLARIAAALAAVGEEATAAQLLATLDALGDEIGARRARVADLNEQTRARTGAALDTETVAEAHTEGRALTLADAVDLALEAASARSSRL
jgi:predicted ATPase/DNA-binding SARP family transcriptional activator